MWTLLGIYLQFFSCKWIVSPLHFTAVGAGRDAFCFVFPYALCRARIDNMTLTITEQYQSTHLSSLWTKALENQPCVHTVAPGVA